MEEFGVNSQNMASGGEDELHLEKLRLGVCLDTECVCVCDCKRTSSEDEEINVCACVCALENVSMCVFPCPPKPNTVNSSMLS